MRYIEIHEKKTKKLVRIVFCSSFEKAKDLFILKNEHKNVYCKDSII